MLIISRKKLEKIMIGDDIEIVVIETGRSRVRLGIKAPKSVSIHSVTEKSAAESAAISLSDLPRTIVRNVAPEDDEDVIPITITAGKRY